MGRRNRILSIEIGYATIRICEMEKGDNPKIHHYLEINTPELSVLDGYITAGKQAEIKTAIMSALKNNKIRTRKAVFTLFSSKIITREVILPKMKDKQLKQVIEENINDYFPIELEDYRVTYSIIDTIVESDKSIKNKMLVIAAEKELVKQYEKLADACRLTLIDVDYVGNSVYQALKKEPRFEAQMYVKVEPENTLIMILEDDRLVLQRSLNMGTGLGENDEEALQTTIRRIVGTVSRVMHFYSGQSYQHIDKVTLIGSGAKYADTFKEIGEESIVLYKAFSISEDSTVLKSADKAENISDYIACIGAGISPVKLINYKSSIKRVNYTRASILMVILYAFVIASLTLMVQIPYLDEVEKNRQFKKSEEFYTEARNVHESLINMQEFYQAFMEGDEKTQHTNDGLLAFLEELEKKLPSDVTVTAMSSNDETVVLQMEVSTKEEVAGTIDTLRGFDTIMSVAVNSVSGDEYDTDENEEPQKVTFSIVCTYYPVASLEVLEGE